MPSLLSLPEELIERILSLAAPNPHAVRSPNALSPLLVSSALYRIGTPALHSALRLTSAAQAAACAASRAVRSLVLSGAFPALRDLACLCPSLREVDLTLRHLEEDEREGETVFAALAQLTDVAVLTVRKDDGTYLTHPRVGRALSDLAHAVLQWDKLHTATLAFRFTPSPATNPLIQSLASRPALGTVRTPAPAAWNTALLTLSANRSLSSIALLAPGAFPPPPQPLSLDYTQSLVVDPFSLFDAHPCAAGKDVPVADPDARTLFLREARKHERLMSLIRCGTPTPRQRAQTLLPRSTGAQRPFAGFLAPPPASAAHHQTASRLARSHSSSALA